MKKEQVLRYNIGTREQSKTVYGKKLCYIVMYQGKQMNAGNQDMIKGGEEEKSMMQPIIDY